MITVNQLTVIYFTLSEIGYISQFKALPVLLVNYSASKPSVNFNSLVKLLSNDAHGTKLFL